MTHYRSKKDRPRTGMKRDDSVQNKPTRKAHLKAAKRVRVAQMKLEKQQ